MKGFGELVQGFPAGEGAFLLHAALDEFPGFQGVVGGLNGTASDSVLADIENGVNGVGHAAEHGALLACDHNIPDSFMYLV